MSRSDAEEFARTLMEDESMMEELGDRLETSDGSDLTEEVLREEMAEEIPNFAAEQGYEFTAEEGLDVLNELQGNDESDALSDVELEQVAGGKHGGRPESEVDSGGGWASCK